MPPCWPVAMFCVCISPGNGAIGVLTSSMGRVANVHFGARVLVPHSAAVGAVQSVGAGATDCCYSFCSGFWLGIQTGVPGCQQISGICHDKKCAI